jgi:cell division protein FtsW
MTQHLSFDDPSRVPTPEGIAEMRFWREALLFAVLVLLGLGLYLAVTVEGPRVGTYAAMQSRALRMMIGLLALFVCARLPWEKLRSRLPMVYVGTLLLLLLPIVIGDAKKGAARWIELGPLSFQPVEILKPISVLLVAELALRRQETLGSLTRGFLPVILPVLAGVSILLLQPDVGHAVFVMAVAVAVLALAGARLLHFLGLILLGAAGFGFLILFGFEHTWRRLAGFLSEEPGFQMQRAMAALSEGGVGGVGPGESWIKLGYLPEARNDFVLAILGNELGLVGALLAIACFALLFVAALRIAHGARTRWERLVAYGLGLTIIVQVAINVLGVTRTIPEKGIDLPLLSSGGTNLVFALGSIGILTHIAIRAGQGPGAGELPDREV